MSIGKSGRHFTTRCSQCYKRDHKKVWRNPTMPRTWTAARFLRQTKYGAAVIVQCPHCNHVWRSTSKAARRLIPYDNT